MSSQLNLPCGTKKTRKIRKKTQNRNKWSK